MDRFIVAAATSLAIGCATWSGEAPSPTIASDGDIAITLEELDDWVKEQLFQERTEGLDPARVYEVRMRSLDPLIEQRVIEREAQRRGVTTEELLASTRSEMRPAAMPGRRCTSASCPAAAMRAWARGSCCLETLA